METNPLETLTLARNATNAYEVVENWHNLHHIGDIKFCDHQPCNAVVAVSK